MTEREKPVWNIGITLVVLIFMNLCLVVFAVLSLENAVADQNLTQKTADHTRAYYTAYSKIEEKWAQAENILKECRQSSENKKAYFATAEKKLQESGFQLQGNAPHCYIIWEEPVAKHQMLYGQAKILWGEPQNALLEVDKMTIQSSGPWNAEQSLDVYKGK